MPTILKAPDGESLLTVRMCDDLFSRLQERDARIYQTYDRQGFTAVNRETATACAGKEAHLVAIRELHPDTTWLPIHFVGPDGGLEGAEPDFLVWPDTVPFEVLEALRQIGWTVVNNKAYRLDAVPKPRFGYVKPDAVTFGKEQAPVAGRFVQLLREVTLYASCGAVSVPVWVVGRWVHGEFVTTNVLVKDIQECDRPTGFVTRTEGQGMSEGPWESMNDYLLKGEGYDVYHEAYAARWYALPKREREFHTRLAFYTPGIFRGIWQKEPK